MSLSERDMGDCLRHRRHSPFGPSLFHVSAVPESVNYRKGEVNMDVAEQSTAALDAEFFTDILERNKSAVRDAVRDTMLESVKRQFQWELPETLKKAVTDFVNEEIVPEVKAELLANKAAFVESATEIARGAAAEIAKAFQEQIAKNLTQSWNVRKVMEALTQ